MVGSFERDQVLKAKAAAHALFSVLSVSGVHLPRDGSLIIRIRNGDFNGCKVEQPVITEAQCKDARFDEKGAR